MLRPTQPPTVSGMVNEGEGLVLADWSGGMSACCSVGSIVHFCGQWMAV